MLVALVTNQVEKKKAVRLEPANSWALTQYTTVAQPPGTGIFFVYIIIALALALALA